MSDTLDKLDEILNLDHGLSKWEVDFIENLDKKRERGFTPSQRKKIDQIHDEKVLGLTDRREELF